MLPALAETIPTFDAKTFADAQKAGGRDPCLMVSDLQGSGAYSERTQG